MSKNTYSNKSLIMTISQGEHVIEIDRNVIGPTCGLLPVGVANSVITTKGLEWDVG